MNAAGALILGATLIGWTGPRILRRYAAHLSDPIAAVIGWMLCVAGALATFAGGVGVLLLPAHRLDGSLAYLLDGCWAAVQEGRLPGLDEVVGVAGLLALLILLVRFTHVATQRLRAQHQTRRAHLTLAGLLGARDAAQPATLWLTHATPFAYSVGGGSGLLVASSGLRQLPAEQVSAVLCHEHAHLRGRHHLWITAAEALARALPFVPLFRQAPSQIRLLVEFAADASASRTCGSGTVRAALASLDGGPRSGSGAAERHDIAIRLVRLAELPAARTSGFMARRASVAVAAALLPPLSAGGTLLLTVCIPCPA